MNKPQLKTDTIIKPEIVNNPQMTNTCLKIDDNTDNKETVKENYNNEWQNTKYPSTITIHKSYFEHILNCLANQQFISELPPEMQRETQKAIDKAWRQGMFICGLNITMNLAYKKMVEKYCEFWNKSIPFIQDCIKDDTKDDTKEYSGDTNISFKFKWLQLVPQEIEMWMRLCCFSNATIDCENEKYERGVISLQDFNYIVDRRGLTTRMKKFLVDILNDIGIGEQLIDTELREENKDKK